MAETETVEAPTTAEAPPLPALPPGLPQPQSFEQIMSGLSTRAAGLPTPQDAMKAAEEAKAAREKQGGVMREAAAAVEPRIDALTAGYDERARQIAATPRPEPPTLPPPPSRGLRAYLATSETDPPEKTIMALLSGLGTLATSLGGLAKGDGRSALSAISGAMQGWAEGDKERADRHFKDWQAATDRLLAQYELQRTSYRDWIETGNLALEQQRAGLLLAATKWDNRKALAAFETGGAEQWAGFLGQMSAQGTELINRAMEGGGSDKLLKLRKGLALLNGIKGPIYINEDPTDLGRLSSNH